MYDNLSKIAWERLRLRNLVVGVGGAGPDNREKIMACRVMEDETDEDGDIKGEEESMKISKTETVTIIEANPEDLRQSNALADSVCALLRRVFNGGPESIEECEAEQGEVAADA